MPCSKVVTIDDRPAIEADCMVSTHATRVLRAAGVSTGGIGTQSRWLAFNRASTRKGYGTQSYRPA